MSRLYTTSQVTDSTSTFGYHQQYGKGKGMKFRQFCFRQNGQFFCAQMQTVCRFQTSQCYLIINDRVKSSSLVHVSPLTSSLSRRPFRHKNKKVECFQREVLVLIEQETDQKNVNIRSSKTGAIKKYFAANLTVGNVCYWGERISLQHLEVTDLKVNCTCQVERLVRQMVKWKTFGICVAVFEYSTPVFVQSSDA